MHTMGVKNMKASNESITAQINAMYMYVKTDLGKGVYLKCPYGQKIIFSVSVSLLITSKNVFKPKKVNCDPLFYKIKL